MNRRTLLLALLLAGCAPAQPTSGPTLRPTAASTEASVATVLTTPGPTRLPTLLVCHEGNPCDAVPGTFVTSLDGFFPGLQITLPAGWFFGEQDAGELAPRPADDPAKGMALFKDVRIVAPNHVAGPANEVVESIPGTAEAFVEWFSSNESFTMVEPPMAASIAGTTGTVLRIAVSEAADFADPGCPSNPRCADFFTDPVHWGPNVFGIGGPTPIQLYVATVSYEDGDHLFAIAWDGGTASELPAFVERTMPILNSVRLPSVYVSN